MALRRSLNQLHLEQNPSSSFFQGHYSIPVFHSLCWLHFIHPMKCFKTLNLFKAGISKSSPRLQALLSSPLPTEPSWPPRRGTWGSVQNLEAPRAATVARLTGSAQLWAGLGAPTSTREQDLTSQLRSCWLHQPGVPTRNQSWPSAAMATRVLPAPGGFRNPAEVTGVYRMCPWTLLHGVLPEVYLISTCY